MRIAKLLPPPASAYVSTAQRIAAYSPMHPHTAYGSTGHGIAAYRLWQLRTRHVTLSSLSNSLSSCSMAPCDPVPPVPSLSAAPGRAPPQRLCCQGLTSPPQCRLTSIRYGSTGDGVARA
eukprot:3940314-Rhodomonas_salina.3